MLEINFTENINPRFTGLGFTDYMYVQRFGDGDWYSADIMPYGECLQPVQSTGLRFGLNVCETIRATLDKDGKICLFRSNAYLTSLLEKADAIGLPIFDHERLMYAIEELVKIERRFVTENTVLFVTVMISATDCGVTPLPVSTAILTVTVEATEKTPMDTLSATKNNIQLDATYGRYAVSACGYPIFFRMDGKIISPKNNEVMTDSLLRLTREWGIEWEDGCVSMDEAVKAHAEGRLAEVFCVDDRALIHAVTELEYNGKKITLETGKLSRKLYDTLCSVERGTFVAHPKWTVRL